MTNHFASAPFCSHPFASNVFTGVKAPKPKPVKVGGGVSGWGGGLGLSLWKTPPNWMTLPDPDCVRDFAKTIRKNHDLLERLPSAEKAAVTKAASKEYDLKHTIASLRNSIEILKRERDEANEKSLLPWALYEKAQQQIDELTRALATAEAQIAQMRQELAAQRAELEELKTHQASDDADAGISYTFEEYVPSLGSFEELWKKNKPVWPAPKPETKGFPWAEFGSALGTLLLTTYAIPDDSKILKTIGYSVSSALALKGVKKLVHE